VTILEAVLYESDADTVVRPLMRRKGLRFVEEFNGVGGGSITLPLADAVDISFQQVVKGTLNGTVVGAFVVESKERSHVTDDGLVWVTLSGRGLMSWLEDAVVWPQGGVTYNYSPTDRPFNFAGISGHWYGLVTWAAPLGFKQSATSSGDYRYKAPVGWPDPSAYWIWNTNPAATVAANARCWMRSTFTLTTGVKLRFYATADNYFNLYLDGALIMSTSDVQAEGANYNGFATKVINVPAGNHILAAYVTNGASGSPGDRAGFLMAISRLDSRGRPTTVLRHTDIANWFVTDDEPKWYLAEIIDALISEQRTRMTDAGQTGPLLDLAVGWSNTLDSDGVAWSTADDLELRVGTSLLDVVNILVDHGVDFWLDPATNTLEAYEARGTDRSVQVLLATGKNLSAYLTTATKQRKTVALVRSALGWTTATDAAGLAAYGRRESFLEFGHTRSETTAANAAARILRRTARATVATPTVSFRITDDVTPFVDFHCGDVVSVPSSTGTTTTARVLSLAVVEDDNGLVTGEADLEVSA